MNREEIELRHQEWLASLTPRQRFGRWWAWWGWITVTCVVAFAVIVATVAWFAVS